MNEKQLKDIEAPSQEEISKKKRRINTAVFSVLSCIFNLVCTVVIVFALILGFSYGLHRMMPSITQEEFSKYIKPIMWGSVIIGIVCGYVLQGLLVKAIILGFKMQNKLEENFVNRYCKNKNNK